MAQHHRNGQQLGFSVDVTAAGLSVSTTTVDSPAPQPKSLIQAATSFAGSMAKFAASGFKTVDEPSHRLRMGQCGECEYRNQSRCTLCQCFVAKKAWLPHEDCPIGRWPT